MTGARVAALGVVLVLVAACTGGSASSPGGSVAASPASPGGSAGATRIEVRLTDALRIEPATISAKAGQPVTFVVTNAGSTNHEFFVGDEGAQTKHGQEMAGMGGMAHDEAMGIGVTPGQTKELTVTFRSAGSMLAGCHVNGHYSAGMKATIDITG